MTAQERKDIEEMAHVLCNEDVSCSECRDILQNRCIELDKAETLRDIGYQKISEGDIIIHKDPTKRTEEEIEWLINHNKAVREEVFNKLIKISRNFDGSVPVGVLKAWAIEFGVEIKNKKYLGGIS